MAKQNRVARNRADLEQELTDQIALLYYTAHAPMCRSTRSPSLSPTSIA